MNHGIVSYGQDINQLGASKGARFSIHQMPSYMDALVEDIVLNEEHPLYAPDGYNVGQAKIRLLGSSTYIPSDSLHWANPIESNIQEFPLKNEVVLVFYALGQLFYSRKLNVSRKVTEHTVTGVTEQQTIKNTRQTANNTRLSSAGGARDDTQATRPEIQVLANPIKHFVGDIVFQGRYGQSIRLGSNRFSRKPGGSGANVIISVGQATPLEVSTGNLKTEQSLVIEDVNRDKTSLWLTEDDTVYFIGSTAYSQSENKAHLRSVLNRPQEYSGAQAILNSDRILINSKLNEVSIFSSGDTNVSALKDITLDSERSVSVTANNDVLIRSWGDVNIRGRSVNIISDEDISYKTAKNYSILGRKIFIGSGADTSQPMVLGTALAEFLSELIRVLQTPGSILSPAGPSVLSAKALSDIVKLQISLGTNTNSIFNSHDNFVSRRNV